MSGIESILPSEKRFDTILCEFRDILTDELIDRAEELDDVLDPQIEFSRDPEYYWKLSHLLARVLASEDEDLGDVGAALYRGFCFATQVVHEIQPKPIDRRTVGEWLEPRIESDAPADEIRSEVSEYLGQRPNIDAFIGFFTPEVAGEYILHEHHVEEGAGLIFMLYEQGLAQSHLNDYMEEAHPQQIIDKET